MPFFHFKPVVVEAVRFNGMEDFLATAPEAWRPLIGNEIIVYLEQLVAQRPGANAVWAQVGEWLFLHHGGWGVCSDGALAEMFEPHALPTCPACGSFELRPRHGGATCASCGVFSMKAPAGRPNPES